VVLHLHNPQVPLVAVQNMLTEHAVYSFKLAVLNQLKFGVSFQVFHCTKQGQQNRSTQNKVSTCIDWHVNKRKLPFGLLVNSLAVL